MMMLSEMIERLQFLQKHYGDMPVAASGDSEGNSHNWAYGIDPAFIVGRCEEVFDSIEEAEECGHSVNTLTQVALVYV